MEAKGKAKSLVEKYQKSELLKDYDGMWDLLAIECAKIAVDEIRKELHEGFFEINEMDVGLRPKGYIEIRLDYWEEVKNELNKM